MPRIMRPYNSLGALAGAALAVATAWAPHRLLFGAAGILTALAAAALAPVIRAAGHLDGPGDDDRPSGGVPTPRVRLSSVWLLGALAAACLLGEGAAANWSAVHLRSLHSSEAAAAGAYAAYSAAMATGRLVGDRLIARFGAATVVRIGAAIAAVGLITGLIVGSTPAALAGWTMLGLGLSTAVPSLITAAGRGGPLAVGAVATTGYLGLLAGPAAIGVLASLTNLPTALVLPALLAALVAVTARRALEPR